MKKPLLILFLTFSGMLTFAQSDLQKFHTSITQKIKYPLSLLNNCVPTYAIIKIQLSNSGSVQNLELSESADSLFKEEFYKKSSQFDFKSLKRYILNKKIKQKTLLLPIYYHFPANSCAAKKQDSNTEHSTLMFSGKTVQGQTYILDGIDYEFLYSSDSDKIQEN